MQLRRKKPRHSTSWQIYLPAAKPNRPCSSCSAKKLCRKELGVAAMGLGRCSDPWGFVSRSCRDCNEG